MTLKHNTRCLRYQYILIFFNEDSKTERRAAHIRECFEFKFKVISGGSVCIFISRWKSNPLTINDSSFYKPLKVSWVTCSLQNSIEIHIYNPLPKTLGKILGSFYRSRTDMGNLIRAVDHMIYGSPQGPDY